jgi:phosphoribosylpyrophosphate synthetase
LTALAITNLFLPPSQVIEVDLHEHALQSCTATEVTLASAQTDAQEEPEKKEEEEEEVIIVNQKTEEQEESGINMKNVSNSEK